MLPDEPQSMEIQIPEIEQENRQRKGWSKTVWILLICFMIMAVIVTVVMTLYHTDERKVLAGFTGLAKEAEEWNELWQEKSGLKFSHSMDKGKMQGSFNISAEEIPFTLGIDIENVRDLDARQVKNNIVFSISNIALAEISVYGDEQEVMISTPDFWKQNLRFQTKHIEEQYNHSIWADIFGPIEENEISIDLFPQSERTEGCIDLGKIIANWKEYTEAGMVIEKMEEPIEITVQDRKQAVYKCSQYRIQIPQDIVEDFTQEEISIQSDLVLAAAMDKHDRMVQLRLEEPLWLAMGTREGTPVEISGEILFLGKERSLDDTLVKAECRIPKEAILTNENMKNFLEEMELGQELLPDVEIVTDMKIHFEGDDIGVTVDFDKLTMAVEGFGTYKMTGSVQMEPLEEAIRPFEGETLELFQMQEEDYQDLNNQFLHNLDKWRNAL